MYGMKSGVARCTSNNMWSSDARSRHAAVSAAPGRKRATPRHEPVRHHAGNLENGALLRGLGVGRQYALRISDFPACRMVIIANATPKLIQESVRSDDIAEHGREAIRSCRRSSAGCSARGG